MAPVTPAPLIVITGPTASGKSALALDIAERWGGEIIAADSRTVYRGMDIGTAKPSPSDRARIRHHLLDIVNPDERFTASDFQQLAYEAIDDVRRRGKVPLLVGGTGLYIDSVVLKYDFSDRDEAERQGLSELSVEKLTAMLHQRSIPLPRNHQNRRHLVHALATKGRAPKRINQPDENTIVVAISTERALLNQKIEQRIREMFASGVISETTHLAERYGWDNESMTGNIYQIVKDMIASDLPLDHAIDMAARQDRRLVKRQLTWLRRHKFVVWQQPEEATPYIEQFLSSHP